MARSSSVVQQERESEPLLGHHHPPPSHMGSQQKSSRLVRWRKHFTVDVNREWGDCVLILCYLITGLLDSASISVWGSFVSMQTGNTVYIGLGLSAPYQSTRWIKSGTSLISFCIGSFLFSRFHRFFSPKRRWVLCASFTLQLILTAAAATMVTLAGVPDDMEAIDWHVLIPIALVAFQSCGQAITSRALQYNALTSVVLTSIYCDLFSDQELFALRNAERNRRTGAPLFLLVGALLGGFCANSSFGIAGSLWAAAGLKAVVVVAWIFWPADPAAEEQV
ncbi:hypothetical protein QBC38DRAFT_408687 [Podospora fimiseda]|uniref:DUF1275 domain protein n=1 Tax=Podospora fimiseda TaxID=252190 RepID=A0AAN7H4P3_9PEZI|nr:hypothetical protein QBC38DRAFT_408687 [Podospora fimiseda]